MPLESSASLSKSREAFEFEEFRADIGQRKLLRNGQPVEITAKVFDTLAFLLRNHGKVVEKEELMRALWPDTVVEEGNLHHYVSTVRKLLGEKPGEHRFIATVPGRGYSFVAPVEIVSTEPIVKPQSSRSPRRLALVAAIVAIAVMVGVVVRTFAHRTGPGSRLTHPLTASLGVADMASFSPDGKEIVFSWRSEKEENFHLYTKAIGSESMRQITSGPGIDYRPAWSPDGLRIAFARKLPERDSGDYCIVPARGGAVTTLTSAFPISFKTPFLTWTRDGNHLIIQDMGTTGQPSRLQLLSLDGKERRWLTVTADNPGDVAPAVSPDGKLLAFLRGVIHGFELRVMPVTGGEPKVVLGRDRNVGPDGIAWTPDSRSIIYRGVDGGLWKIPLEGGGPERLGVGSDEANYPVVSAKGDLAFTEPARRVALVSITLPSPGQTPATVRELLPSTRGVSDPQWSPDGKQIAFESDRSGSTEIWRSDANGGNLVRLTSFGGRVTRHPRWSPDGKMIALESRPESNADIYLISSNGGAPRRLTTEPSVDISPAWSNDGKTIYFSSNRSGTNQIWKMPATGGVAAQVTSDGGALPNISADGYLYFLKAPLTRTVWRMPLEGGKDEIVIDGATRGGNMWAPVIGGVYYMDRSAALRFFDARSRNHSDPIFQLPYPELLAGIGVGASQDGRSVLVPRVRESGTDIMIVEKFW